MTTVDGIVVVDKPGGWTSHDVVSRIRRLARTRRVGHAGTLDPMATGVLVLGVERATRLLGHLALREKAYEATVRLGASTVTDDAEGAVLGGASPSGLSRADVEAGIARLTGPISQVPSSVSAVKVAGERAYRRVRSGEEVTLEPRPVEVALFELVSMAPSGEFLDVDVRVECSSGTYIRALARDLGASLGVGGHLTSLRRTRVGTYTLSDASTMEQLDSSFHVIPIATVAAQTFPRYDVDEAMARLVGYGQKLPDLDLGAEGPVAMFAPDGRFLALYELAGDPPIARPIAVFAT
ncbi:tRNA pseudouridine(55) synthase TruB [Tenggerimyces flavus]|uniref:tRNA pseudouridine synthase B n=1 Tax=Tenggerimyces flavus TaxID=1708749 RepID=A0ABV7YB70_9ACTN|nr:tRNA pseudouridine(55) synthase TruB [Tenggerimyces flavus]MBM7786888.1 tRNA pseudouridine55 synthase [Tenggerimyces flavus]